ncbi:hypothetical protein B0H13DRAFT_2319603 [Mycena leptocephala]|nr:hypothetical protein B0H13DRAFT_2319603 [Mycena leptocephala]
MPAVHRLDYLQGPRFDYQSCTEVSTQSFANQASHLIHPARTPSALDFSSSTMTTPAVSPDLLNLGLTLIVLSPALRCALPPLATETDIWTTKCKSPSRDARIYAHPTLNNAPVSMAPGLTPFHNTRCTAPSVLPDSEPASPMLYHAHIRKIVPTYTITVLALAERRARAARRSCLPTVRSPEPFFDFYHDADICPVTYSVDASLEFRLALACMTCPRLRRSWVIVACVGFWRVSLPTLFFLVHPLSPIIFPPLPYTNPLVSHLIRSRASPHLNQQEHVGVAGTAFSLSSTPPERPERRLSDRRVPGAMLPTRSTPRQHTPYPTRVLPRSRSSPLTFMNGALRSIRTSFPELVDCLSGGPRTAMPSHLGRSRRFGSLGIRSGCRSNYSSNQHIYAATIFLCVDFPLISFSIPVLPLLAIPSAQASTSILRLDYYHACVTLQGLGAIVNISRHTHCTSILPTPLFTYCTANTEWEKAL